MKLFFGILGAVVLVFLASVLLFPTFADDGIRAPASMCLSSVKQSSLGLILYAGDENDRFPSRDRWMDATYPYTKTEAIWHCPSVPKNVYGYAFNGAMSLASQAKLADPAGTPLLYDSVDPVRNASDLCASLPLPGRHGREHDEEGQGRNNVAYADGHAKGVVARPLDGRNPQDPSRRG